MVKENRSPNTDRFYVVVWTYAGRLGFVTRVKTGLMEQREERRLEKKKKVDMENTVSG